MRRLLVLLVGCGLAVSAAGSALAAAGCVAQPTPKCLLADAQAAAMSLMDNVTALPNLAFIGWAQAITGDQEAARDTLRVSELRARWNWPDNLPAAPSSWPISDGIRRLPATKQRRRRLFDRRSRPWMGRIRAIPGSCNGRSAMPPSGRPRRAMQGRP